MALSAGTRLGPYEVIAPLGAGGMGEVYRAKDGRLGRSVAVKVLPDRLARDEEARRRFEREARAVAALSHPNILAIHDFGADTDLAYAVMELLEGQTLDNAIAGPLVVGLFRLRLQFGLGDGPKMHQAALGEQDVEFEHVVDGLAVDYGMGAGGVVGDHAADGRPAGGRDVGGEEQPVRPDLEVEVVEHAARPDVQLLEADVFAT